MCLCLNGFGLHLNAIHFVRFDVITCGLLVCSRRATINCHNIATGSFVHLMKFICSIKSWLTFVFVRICFCPHLFSPLSICYFIIFLLEIAKEPCKVWHFSSYILLCPCKKQQQWKWKYHAKAGEKKRDEKTNAKRKSSKYLMEKMLWHTSNVLGLLMVERKWLVPLSHRCGLCRTIRSWADNKYFVSVLKPENHLYKRAISATSHPLI